MGLAGLLELKNLGYKYQVYKVNYPNDKFLCKPLYDPVVEPINAVVYKLLKYVKSRQIKKWGHAIKIPRNYLH